jgi:preprotein translocase subunit YajC
MRTTVESLGTLLPLVIILLAFWLLIIRPARMRTRKQAELLSKVTPGQEVMTTSGLYATVAAVEDDVVVLEASPGVRTRWAKAAVARILPAPTLSDPAGDE